MYLFEDEQRQRKEGERWVKGKNSWGEQEEKGERYLLSRGSSCKYPQQLGYVRPKTGARNSGARHEW